MERRLTIESSEEGRPSWSHDSRWIYFRSDRSGTQQIWKMPVGGGPAVQITQSGGYEGFESNDGTMLFFAKMRPQRGLWRVRVTGGKEEFVTGTVREGYWAVADSGVYFIDVDLFLSKRAGSIPVKRVHPETREVTLWASLRSQTTAVWLGFSAGEGGRTLLWTQADRR